MKNKTFLQYLQDNHIIIDALCNGQKQCGKCQIKILNRDVDFTEQEKSLLTQKQMNEKVHLACCHQYHSNDQIVVMNQEMKIIDDIEENLTSVYQGIGVIIDIGTTTIVMKWIERSTGQCIDSVSFINPQVSYGGDVITRIHYQNQNKTTLLHDVLITSIEEQLLEKAKEVNQIIICGNPTMIHFFLNADVTPLGMAPFEVPKKDMQRINSQNIFRHYPYNCEIITFPHISAFVGGDIVSGIYAYDIDKIYHKVLMVDLGTNGEIVVGNKEGIIVTSTAAGPAFEGVGMSCGGGSISGAIENVRLDPIKIETIHQQKPTCICGSGYISLLKEMVEKRIISPIGKLINEEEFYITNHLFINQNDISNFQLAKAAIQTGISILLESDEIDTIYIAGGFGSHINIDDLKVIQVIPQNIKYAYSIGNSAIKGCYKLLMSQDFQRIHNIINKSKSINLADNKDFEDMLVESLYFYD